MKNESRRIFFFHRVPHHTSTAAVEQADVGWDHGCILVATTSHDCLVRGSELARGVGSRDSKCVGGCASPALAKSFSFRWACGLPGMHKLFQQYKNGPTILSQSFYGGELWWWGEKYKFKQIKHMLAPSIPAIPMLLCQGKSLANPLRHDQQYKRQVIGTPVWYLLSEVI